jgi:N-acetylglucosamine-6-phosphate deacetylase
MFIKNCKIIFEDDIKLGSVIIKNGLIKNIILDKNYHNIKINNANSIINAEGLYLSPGFIDVHIHGAGGYDTMDASYNSINNISKTIIKQGTTSFLPTTMTCSINDISKAIIAVKSAIIKGTEGANVLGIHLEGPFINSNMLGAQNKDYIQIPSIATFKSIVGNNMDIIKSITLAPEISGAVELIAFISSLGIIVSLGHSKGTYAEVMEGIKAGICHSTHLFNAMSPFHHREPGAVGAIFDSNITAEIICDGLHVSYPSIRIALKQKGIDNTILVSDAVMACGMPDGMYKLGGQTIYVVNNVARLNDKTLAGSTLTLDKAIKNLYKNTSYKLHEIVKMATSIPAKYCKVHNHKGIIKEGHDADLLLFDEDINIKKVILGGHICNIS